MPAISVLMPTFNQLAFLPRALDALAAQSFTDFEVIVCNDGSTDDTDRILVESGLCFLAHDTNRGTAAAINSAAAWASGEILTWVSSDNVMHPNWLSVLYGEMHRHNAGAVYSGYRRIEDNGEWHAVMPPDYEHSRLIASENCYFGPSFLIRRDVWPEHRGGTAHDYDSWLRVEEECWEKGYQIRCVDRMLCDYYRGEWNTCRRRPDLYDAAHWLEEAGKRRSA